MKKYLIDALIFTVGAAIGSVVTWKFIKTKYEQIAQEEIDSVRELYYSGQNSDSEDEEASDDDETDEIAEYGDLIDKAGYKKYEPDKINEEEEDEMNEPYVITPEEFDENGYETETLFYYADGVLAYGDTDEIVENVDELVGEESLTHFGEYEEDSVFVRNDKLGIDFEILKDRRRFSEVD